MTGTERKVFQKYYPPDFDPSKIPKAKGSRNRQFVQRIMTAFNMQCNTCKEYIYKGKKFNMRRETVEGETYLGMKIFRFYFRCPNCLAEITFKTDIENVDYQAEHGATRLFDVFKSYQEQEREKEQEEEEEKQDAMKMLQKRTKMSKIEMEALGEIEELQEASRRAEKIDTLKYLDHVEKEKALTMSEKIKLQEDEDARELQRIMSKKANIVKLGGPSSSKLIADYEDDEEEVDDDNPDIPGSSSRLSSFKMKPSAGIKVGPSFAKPGLSSIKRPLVGSLNSKEKKLPKFMSNVVVKKKTS